MINQRGYAIYFDKKLKARFAKCMQKYISSYFCLKPYPAGSYMFKVNNRNTRTRCEICSKLTIKTLERRHWRVNTGWVIN